MPPRFLERFSNRKVKQGASITLSVKVEGLFTVRSFYHPLTPKVIWGHPKSAFYLVSKTLLIFFRVSHSYGVLAEGGINGRCVVDQA